MFMRCQVSFISILQEPLGAAWYSIFLKVRTLPFPAFTKLWEKNDNPSYRRLSSTLSDRTPGIFVGARDLPVPLDIPI
jgi:hypothetical protein